MGLLDNIAQGIRSLFRRQAIEHDMDAELREFIDASTAEKVRRGMPAEEAARAARVEMGSANAVKHHIRSATWESRMEIFLRDLQILRPRAVAQPRLHADCRAVARARHRRQHRDLHAHQAGSASEPSCARSTATGDVRPVNKRRHSGRHRSRHRRYVHLRFRPATRSESGSVPRSGRIRKPFAQGKRTPPRLPCSAYRSRPTLSPEIFSMSSALHRFSGAPFAVRCGDSP